ncbi:MAG: reverse transcriptase family protein [Candidatus Gracilibacteria bacterium]|nr:reverse transcriptase family protein [Candidatus Gracilibacteria bacterium]
MEEKYIYESENINLDLEKLFGFSYNELVFFSLSKRGKYKKIEILKRSGKVRTLYSPVYKLKRAQRIILKEILYKKSNYLLIDNVTGFIPQKSIVDNAKYHIGKKYILKLDIKDFFPSITQDRIFGLFRKEYNLDYSTSMYLSGLCCYNNQLPQGAPTSPILSNLIARFLDYRLIGLIKSYNSNKFLLELSYSRYADDLTFSFNKKINVNGFINYIIGILLEEGFFPNYEKINLISAGKQQKVTGLVVNSKVSVGRKYYKKLKSIFYNISKNGFLDEMLIWNSKNENKIYKIDKFKQVLGGYLSFIKNISPDYYEKLNNFNLDFSIGKIKNDIKTDISKGNNFGGFNL